MVCLKDSVNQLRRDAKFISVGESAIYVAVVLVAYIVLDILHYGVESFII